MRSPIRIRTANVRLRSAADGGNGRSERADKGSVTLVGAGPGDPELLTLRAVRALQSADVILFDDLVSPDVLEFARREAKKMLVGKTGHGPSCKQDEINDLMVGLAKAGRRVVRLKGGDPMIFGRAGEEIAPAARPASRSRWSPASPRRKARRAGSAFADAAPRRAAGAIRHRSWRRRRAAERIDWRSLADPRRRASSTCR